MVLTSEYQKSERTQDVRTSLDVMKDGEILLSLEFELAQGACKATKGVRDSEKTVGSVDSSGIQSLLEVRNISASELEQWEEVL